MSPPAEKAFKTGRREDFIPEIFPAAGFCLMLFFGNLFLKGMYVRY